MWPATNRYTCLVALSLSLLACLLPVDYARSQTDSSNARLNNSSNSTFNVNLRNVDIHSLIETVSKHTGKNFIVDPRVRATVSVVSSEPVSAEKLYELFLSVLEVHGYTAISTGIIHKIVPIQNGVQSSIPILKDQTNANNELSTQIIKIENTSAQQLIEVLRPLLPAAASINAEINSNTIIITDSADNITRLTQLIRQLDKQN